MSLIISQKIQAHCPAGDKKGHAKKMKVLKEIGNKKILKMLGAEGLAAVKKHIDGLVKKELG